MDPALAELVEVLAPEDIGDHRYRAASITFGGLGRVFGAQLLAQMVICAARTVPDKSVKSLQAMFVRPAESAKPLDVEVDLHHRGRLYATATVTVAQEGRLCARALVLLDQADVELARHSRPMPAVVGPEAASAVDSIGGGLEVRMVGDIDLGDPQAIGDPEIQLWARFPDAPSDDGLARALLAYATESFFWGTALRPHRGLGSSLAYVEIVPAVLTHSVIFHDALDVAEWFLLDLCSPFVGRGRIYGHGSVYRPDGALVASINQENQLRPV